MTTMQEPRKEEVAQWILVREDLFLGTAEVAKVVADSCAGAVLQDWAIRSFEGSEKVFLWTDPEMSEWLKGDQKKVILGVRTINRLFELSAPLVNKNLRYKYARHNTELAAVCIGPAYKSMVWPWLKDLHLYGKI